MQKQKIGFIYSVLVAAAIILLAIALVVAGYFSSAQACCRTIAIEVGMQNSDECHRVFAG